MSTHELPSIWRARAQHFRLHKAEAQAVTYERAADELEAKILQDEHELLTLREAAAVSGYSTDHLSREIRQGKLQNYGRKGAPRVRRGELPRKAKGEQGGTGSNTKVYDVNRLARKIADSKFGS